MFLPKMPCSRNRGQPLHRGRISNGGLWVSAPPPFPPCAWEKPRYPPDRGRPRRAFSARPRSRPYRRRSRWSVGGKQQLAAISTFVRNISSKINWHRPPYRRSGPNRHPKIIQPHTPHPGRRTLIYNIYILLLLHPWYGRFRRTRYRRITST